MSEYKIDSVIRVLETCIKTVLEQKDILTEIDSKSGDGDMGISMEKGALALKQTIGKCDDSDDIGGLFTKCGSAFNKAAPSTMGTLISMGLIALGRGFAGRTVLLDEEARKIPGILAETISKFGKSKRGDKTVLDALCPFAKVLENGDSLKKAAEAAEAGAESTKGMIAKAGRARWIGERASEYPDGGAVLCALIAKDLGVLPPWSHRRG
jgi:dihydroxyacetone kinase